MYIKIKEPYEQTIHIMKVHHETEDCYVCELKKDNSYLSASKEWVLAKSENLEELCDEFVMTHYFKETNYTKCEVLKEDKDLMIKAVRLKKQNNKDRDLKNEFNIYGCIWCEFGLKYVVKMNDKGELELL